MAITDLLFGYPIIFWTAAHELDQDQPAQCRTEADFTRLSGTSSKPRRDGRLLS
jgi:hypothetical protein